MANQSLFSRRLLLPSSSSLFIVSEPSFRSRSGEPPWMARRRDCNYAIAKGHFNGSRDLCTRSTSFMCRSLFNCVGGTGGGTWKQTLIKCADGNSLRCNNNPSICLHVRTHHPSTSTSSLIGLMKSHRHHSHIKSTKTITLHLIN